MSRLALLVLALLVVVSGAVAVVLTSGADGRGVSPAGDAPAVGGGAARVPGGMVGPEGRAADLPTAAADADAGGAAPVDLTPVPVEGHFGPAVPREGRTATLLPVVRRDGVPVAAELVFVAGPDEGLRVPVAATDSPAPIEVFPGFAILEVRPAGGGLCRREWLLEHRRTATLELDFVTRGLVDGTVTDTDGTPVAGAVVSLDGVETRTNADGAFRCELLVSGEPLLHVDAPGFVPHRESLSADVASAPKPHAVTLKRGSSLTLAVADLPEVHDGEVTLQLFPSGGPLSSGGGRVQSLYPWERLDPLRLPPGGRITLHDLPPCRLEVVAWHGRASGGPEAAYLLKEPTGVVGAAGELVLTLRPHDTLAGRVVHGEEPVPGARVRLEYANPIRATHRILGGFAEHARRLPVGIAPAAAQAVVTGGDGRFALGIDPRIGKPPYVTVVDPAGRVSVTRVVEDATAKIVFDLARPGR